MRCRSDRAIRTLLDVLKSKPVLKKKKGFFKEWFQYKADLLEPVRLQAVWALGEIRKMGDLKAEAKKTLAGVRDNEDENERIRQMADKLLYQISSTH